MSAAEVLFGGEGVVAATKERQVLESRWAAARKRLSMMKLEKAGFAAAPTLRIDISTTASIAFLNAAAHLGRGVSAALARVSG